MSKRAAGAQIRLPVKPNQAQHQRRATVRSCAHDLYVSYEAGDSRAPFFPQYSYTNYIFLTNHYYLFIYFFSFKLGSKV